MTERYRLAYDETTALLIDMNGLVLALHDQIARHEALTLPNPEACAINALSSVLRDMSRRVMDLREDEWDAAKGH